MIGALVAAASVAVHTKPETTLHIHLFTKDVKRESFAFFKERVERLHAKCIVEEHVCDDALLEGVPSWRGSKMTFVRCFLDQLLPTVDWCLYLDCDILYLASPEEHIALGQQGTYVSATPCPFEPDHPAEVAWAKQYLNFDFDPALYFNAGVILFNLKQCREENTSDKIRAFVDRFRGKILYADQTVLNMLFYGQTRILPGKYNAFSIYLTTEQLLDAPVIHYAGDAPWVASKMQLPTNRFKLWHAFADKYIWEEKGASYRYCFGKRCNLIPTLLLAFIRCPIIGRAFATFANHFVKDMNLKIIRKRFLRLPDCSTDAVSKVL